MNKRLARCGAFILILSLLPLAGCGAAGSEAGAEAPAFAMDVEACGDQLRRELEFRDQLEELEPPVVYALLGVDGGDVAAQKNYFGSGATAEEIIIFQAAGSEAAGRLRLALEARIESQKEIYASYAPNEVAYLRGAVLEQKGDYLVYCVAADGAAAKDLIDRVLKDQ